MSAPLALPQLPFPQAPLALRRVLFVTPEGQDADVDRWFNMAGFQVIRCNELKDISQCLWRTSPDAVVLDGHLSELALGHLAALDKLHPGKGPTVVFTFTDLPLNDFYAARSPGRWMGYARREDGVDELVRRVHAVLVATSRF